MYREIEHVSGNLYELKAKPSMEEFFDMAIRGEVTLAPDDQDIILHPGKPEGIEATGRYEGQ